ncbi:hypothetical protein [Lysobacter olei]
MTTGGRHDFPTERGDYAVWLVGADRPRLLLWSGLRAYEGEAPTWRWGAMKVEAAAWCGPLVKPRAAK